MKKKAFALSLALLLGLAACGASAEKEAANTNPARESQTAASQPAEVKPAEPPSAESKPAGSQEASSQESASKPSETQDAASTPASSQTSSSKPSASTAPAGSASSESSVPANSSSTSVPSDDYLTIALFGLDANKNPSGTGEDRWAKLMRQFRSDTIMIACINRTTGDVKVVSVYRDTFLDTGNGSYQKANAAYSGGGSTRAIEMLNKNLDLNIDKFIAVSYHSLMDLVDGLGGITVDVEKAALKEIDGYQTTIVNDLGLPGYTPVTEAGSQTLNGLQTCAYCRLRHDFPRGDLDRAAHQRKVLRAIEAKAKQTDPTVLIPLFHKVFGEIHTNMDSATLLELVTNISDYRFAGEGGFPTDKMVTIATLGKKGSCVVPVDLESNVVWLHQFLFEDENYVAPQTVKDISEHIKTEAAPYIKK